MPKGIFPAPHIHPLVDKNGAITPPWAQWADGIYRGDAGTEWTPNFVGLTSTGTPTITGVYYRISERMFAFAITVTPATDTTAVSGTTYVDNFPPEIQSDWPCFATIPPVSAIGACDASSNRIYVPAWTSITTPVTITGIAEAR